VAGHVVFSRGSVAAQAGNEPNASPRILGPAAEIYESDVIQTGPDSFAIIEFIDKAKMTVRPNTSFSIEKYAREGQQEAKLNLYKGGVRASGGEIAERHPDQFQVQTPLATIKPGGTEFSARLCENDCVTNQGTQQQPTEMPPGAANAVARVVQAQGRVSAENQQGSRDLQVGSPLFEQDRIRTQADSFAVLLFRDSGKITVQAQSEFLISEYRYEAGGKNNKSILKLISGGVRALTGLIGRENRKNYQVATPVATIGIRGTGFDLTCLGDCVAEGQDIGPEQLLADSQLAEKIGQGKAEGLYSYVWQHSITLNNDAGSFDVEENHASYVANSNSPAIPLVKTPDLFFQNLVPRPDQIKSGKGGGPAKSGLYVAVKGGGGSVKVENDDGNGVEVTGNQEAYVDPAGDSSVITDADDFIAEDNLPSPSTSPTDVASTYSLLVDDIGSISSAKDSGFQCESQ
jgi:hypothetical protein